MIFIFILLLSLALVALLIHHLRYRRQMNQELDSLLDYMMTVQNRHLVPKIEQQAEGRFRILQSELYKLASLLQEAYSLEASRNRDLSQFLSDISHQIKTPLAAILMMTHLLEDDSLSLLERENYSRSIESQVDRMTWLVKTLLTSARLDAGVLVLKKETTHLQQLLEQVISTHALMAEAKGLAIYQSGAEGLLLTCDQSWTYEALSNIVKNCLEHTQTGSVSLRAQSTNLSTDIWIEDTGQGISPQELPRIFERFYRGSHTDKQSVGIGLSLAQDIIQRQNGTIQVTSQEGSGTCFHIRFYHRSTL